MWAHSDATAAPKRLAAAPKQLTAAIALVLCGYTCAYAPPPVRVSDAVEKLTTDQDASYDPSLATLFAHYSNAAYCSGSSIASWGCAACQKADPAFSPKFFENTSVGTQGYVGRSTTGDIVVAFRGSSNIKNWIDNLEFGKVDAYPKCDGCEVHHGFYQAWLSLQSVVLAEVTRLKTLHPESKVYVTGHSLGAAMAAHCATELGASSHSLGYPIAGVYTFGQPRVGNGAFADFYSQGTHVSWRVTHWRDTVPHLPPESFGFKHSGTEVFYTQDNSKYTLCDGTGEDNSCSDQFYLDLGFDDHNHYMSPPLTGEIDSC